MTASLTAVDLSIMDITGIYDIGGSTNGSTASFPFALQITVLSPAHLTEVGLPRGD